MVRDIEHRQVVPSIEVAGNLRRPENENFHLTSTFCSDRHTFDVADLVPSVKQGVLYRTGWTLASLCPSQSRSEDCDTVSVDLRSQPEISDLETVSEFAIDVPNITSLLGARPGIEEYTNLYSAIVEVSGPQIASVANLLANSPRMTIGCSLGKDRTGVVIAFLLRAAGIPPADILYADRAAMAHTIACDPSIRTYAHDRGIDATELIRRCQVGRMPLQMVLESMDDHRGGVEGYLRRHGMYPTTASTLRKRLLR
ncbi:tyrosine-protein phosphatase [Nocardia asiatica]|uniref:tyrosine-protein phosphatase n=1 Tax=Nocardia asiatica TaxID=209252 RepID=UPI0012FB99FF|nr:tyrosine-protein phosphatase [Nocardia asiatica]